MDFCGETSKLQNMHQWRCPLVCWIRSICGYSAVTFTFSSYILIKRRIQDFQIEGAPTLCACSTKREVHYSLRPAQGPGSSRILDALSCYLSLILKPSITKLDLKKHSQSKFRGGASLLRPRLDPPLSFMLCLAPHLPHNITLQTQTKCVRIMSSPMCYVRPPIGVSNLPACQMQPTANFNHRQCKPCVLILAWSVLA